MLLMLLMVILPKPHAYKRANMPCLQTTLARPRFITRSMINSKPAFEM